MDLRNKIVTSEYVAHGHPDKLADIISDSILQEIYNQDENARAGIETMVKDNVVVLGGEVKTTAVVDYETIVRNVFENDVKYPSNHNLTPDNIKIINLIGQQSPEISAMVDKEDGEIGAGDQGFCVGYASSETSVMMPLGAYLAKKICQRVAYHGYGPDAKSQVVVEYDNEGKALIKNILVSVLHTNHEIDIVRHFVMDDIQWVLSEFPDNFNEPPAISSTLTVELVLASVGVICAPVSWFIGELLPSSDIESSSIFIVGSLYL
jgi:S-adenosylmethionine synthetase